MGRRRRKERGEMVRTEKKKEDSVSLLLDFVKLKLQVKRGGEQMERINGISTKKRGEKMKIK